MQKRKIFKYSGKERVIILATVLNGNYQISWLELKRNCQFHEK